MKKKAKKITMDVLAGMVQRGFSEMGGRFDKVDDRLDKVEGRLDTVEKDIKSLREDFRKILDSLDKVAKQYADYLEERKMRDAEIARLKKWVEQIAQKVGVELVD